jgi:hypothetical protein
LFSFPDGVSEENERSMESWIKRLKTAYQAGYYQTEAAEGSQITFPWQNKTCKDCPFWSNSICQVFAEYRGPRTHTCAYFDPWHRDAAGRVIRERQWSGFRQWWSWFKDRDAAH